LEYDQTSLVSGSTVPSKAEKLSPNTEKRVAEGSLGSTQADIMTAKAKIGSNRFIFKYF
jgi:hypothetical protein